MTQARWTGLVVVAFSVGAALGLVVRPWPLLDRQQTPHAQVPQAALAVTHDTVFVTTHARSGDDDRLIRTLAKEMYVRRIEAEMLAEYVGMTFGEERAKTIVRKAHVVGYREANSDSTLWWRWTQ